MENNMTKCFIVPNACGTSKDFFMDSQKKMAQDFFELNGKEFDEKEKLIQVWIHNERCDNMIDHYFQVPGTNLSGQCFGYIPESFLKDIKEGDVKELIIPGHTYDESGKHAAARFKMKIKFQQKGYRYERFGNFEDVVASLA